jgi:hypothetical protein
MRISCADASAAFSTLLASHIFQCPASIGIAAAIRSGMLQISPVKGKKESAPLLTLTNEQAEHPPVPVMRPAPSARGGPPIVASYESRKEVSVPPPPTYAPPSPRTTSGSRPSSPRTQATMAQVSRPADVYEYISRKTSEMKLEETAPPGYPGGHPYPYYYPPPGYSIPPGQSMPPPQGFGTPGYPSMPASGHAGYPYAYPSHGESDYARPPSPRAAVSPGGHVRAVLSPSNGGGSVISNSHSRPRSPRREERHMVKSSLGTSSYRPSIAGAGNRPGGVYDRLSSPDSFTGMLIFPARHP